MIKILLLLLLPFLLYASKILNYNVYDRTDRVDIMLTFDTPFHGIIKQNTTHSKIILTLENVNIEAPKFKQIQSKYLQTLSIVPLKNATQIIATIPNQSVKLIASKTTDGYGLRLRFTTKAIQKSEHSIEKQDDSLASTLPTKKDDDMQKSYYIVIGILLLGIFILLYIKKKIEPKQKKQSTASKKKETWLFKSTNAPAQQQPQATSEENVSIRFQKAIDEHTSVVMLDFGTQSYLVLMGNNNILLDKFTDNKPTSQQEFESILQSRSEELESFLATPAHEKEVNGIQQSQEPLQAYKERAATLLYSEQE